MKEISYKNPYDKIPVVIQIEDDDVEGLEEVIHFLNDNTRIIDNLERRERYHTAYHIEGLIYEGMEYAADEDVASNVARTENEQRIDEWLRENLTSVQYRRFVLFMDGLIIREVARCEGIDYSSANESIKAAQKKLKKILVNTPSKSPFKCPYSEKK